MKIYSGTIWFEVSHLSAVQGSIEELKGGVQKVHRLSPGNTDAVMCQEHGKVSSFARNRGMR